MEILAFGSPNWQPFWQILLSRNLAKDHRSPELLLRLCVTVTCSFVYLHTISSVLLCKFDIFIFFSNQLQSIETLELFMLKHRKDYMDLYRTTEQERDSIEHEVSRNS